MNSTGRCVMRKVIRPEWLEGVDAALGRLPWNRHPGSMDPASVAELVRVLHQVRPDDAPVPQIHLNCDGGAMVVWELGYLYMKVQTSPDRPAQYLYTDDRDVPGLSNEGEVRGNEERLQRWAGRSGTSFMVPWVEFPPFRTPANASAVTVPRPAGLARVRLYAQVCEFPSGEQA